MRHADVVVVGAGPAGALAAARLARAGRKVLLVDRARFPREKVCGGCLQPSALRALETGGLGGLVERKGGVPLREFVLHAGGGAARIPLEGGAAISRRALDQALVEAAIGFGVEFREGVRARLGPAGADCREVVLDGLGTVRADIVLDATGLAGGLSGVARVRRGSLLGAGVVLDEGPLPPGTVRMACAPGGYVGMVRAEGGRCVVAAALAQGLVAREGGLGAAAASILSACGLPPLPGNAAWHGTPPLTRRPPRLWHERVLLVGDAAGYVEPFTGEGMSWALRSALAAAELAREGWTEDSGLRWERMHRQAIGGRQLRCRALTLLLRAPRLVRAAVRVLERAPVFARPFVRAAASGSVP
jgi:flavin-dependent dehydrogenase